MSTILTVVPTGSARGTFWPVRSDHEPCSLAGKELLFQRRINPLPFSGRLGLGVERNEGLLGVGACRSQ
jgi:hypothetical protein